MKLAIVVSHAGASCLGQAMISWGGRVPVFLQDGKGGMLPAYQSGLRRVSDDVDILAYLHDDTIIDDLMWPARVLAEFDDPAVGLVGFGGALGHGTAGLYRDPYEYRQLAREDFMSNMVDAENHGRRFEGSCDVAVLDGFALIVRREVLQQAGGWPLSVPHDFRIGKARNAETGEECESPVANCVRCHYRIDSPNIPPCPSPIGYIAYDYWLSCMTRRLGYRIRLVGVPCQHLGGQTFVKLGIGRDEKYWQQYLDSHRYIYDEFRDVLPYRVSQ